MDNPTPTDQVLVQLRRLREGRGLTVARLKESGDLLSALGTSDPVEAMEILQVKLSALPDSPQVRALRVDLGLDLETLLGLPPTADERRLLTDRRSGYSVVVSRDVKTLARWSDRAAAELRATLLADQFTGQISVIAAVDGDRVAGITVIRHGADSATRRDIRDEMENFAEGPSLPALIYAFPRDWRPSSIKLAVAFRRRPYPERVWAVVAPNFFDLSFAADRYPLPLHEGMAMAQIESPKRDKLFAIFWDTRVV